MPISKKSVKKKGSLMSFVKSVVSAPESMASAPPTGEDHDKDSHNLPGFSSIHPSITLKPKPSFFSRGLKAMLDTGDAGALADLSVDNETVSPTSSQLYSNTASPTDNDASFAEATTEEKFLVSKAELDEITMRAYNDGKTDMKTWRKGIDAIVKGLQANAKAREESLKTITEMNTDTIRKIDLLSGEWNRGLHSEDETPELRATGGTQQHDQSQTSASSTSMAKHFLNDGQFVTNGAEMQGGVSAREKYAHLLQPLSPRPSLARDAAPKGSRVIPPHPSTSGSSLSTCTYYTAPPPIPTPRRNHGRSHPALTQSASSSTLRSCNTEEPSSHYLPPPDQVAESYRATLERSGFEFSEPGSPYEIDGLCDPQSDRPSSLGSSRVATHGSGH